MAERVVLSVNTKPEIRERLDRLAKETRRSKSFLANEAIERYLAAEEGFITSIKQGMIDAEEGRVSSSKDMIERARIKLLDTSVKSNHS